MNLKIEYIPADRIKFDPNNSRTHSDAQISQIAESLRQFGFVNPVLADANLTLIAGEGRCRAAALAGITLIPVIRLTNLSERERRALAIADNRIAQNAGWNFEVLGRELNELIDLGIDVTGLGFDEQEIDALLRDDMDILPEPFQHTQIVKPVQQIESNNQPKLPGQQIVGDTVDDHLDEWKNMPEFANEYKGSWKSLTVHFKTPEDKKHFEDRLGVPEITTRYLWWPEIVIEPTAHIKYKAE